MTDKTQWENVAAGWEKDHDSLKHGDGTARRTISLKAEKEITLKPGDYINIIENSKEFVETNPNRPKWQVSRRVEGAAPNSEGF